MEDSLSLTGRYLGDPGPPLISRKKQVSACLQIRGARLHNLKAVDVSLPLNRLVSVTGVSGSGKSSLILDTLGNHQEHREFVDEIEGLDAVDRIIEVDQKGIGRSSRSNVATYTDLFSPIRRIFARRPEALKLGLESRHFSFNVKGGRCESCQGLGSIPLDMHFLEDVEVECPECRGSRFHKEVLGVPFRGRTISDILNLTVEENLSVFGEYPEVLRRLAILKDVGLEYLTLGQSTSTLSGGECQRIKLSRELGRADRGHTLYLLDEPSAGLHPGDSKRLIELLRKLVDRGHSVIVIEHSMDLVSRSDWIIDMGPEGGHRGGSVVAEGTPEQLRRSGESPTSRYL
jgi:excinuclease ABC subunit A